MIWLAGSVYHANWTGVQVLALWLVVPLALALLAARELDLIRFGDNAAQTLGQRVNLVREFMILLCILLSGAAVAAAGLIGFVGLVASHFARRLVGPAHAKLIPVTALIGAPFFVCLLWGRRHVAA